MEPIPEIQGIEYDRSLPVMDMEQLEMLIMVDEDDDEDSHALIRELYDLFTHESDQKMEGLASVCEQNDVEEARKIIHFVAGSAGNLGLARLSAFYRAIEKALDLETLVDISRLAEPVITEYRLGCEGLHKVILDAPSSGE